MCDLKLLPPMRFSCLRYLDRPSEIRCYKNKHVPLKDLNNVDYKRKRDRENERENEKEIGRKCSDARVFYR